MKSANGVFNRNQKQRTNINNINNNVTVSSASGTFHYQHGCYFRDELILQTISRISSNCGENQIAFVNSFHQYNDAFHYHLYIKKVFFFDNREF